MAGNDATHEGGGAGAHGRLTYLQIPSADTDRSAAFYENVLGWQVEGSYPSFEAPGLIGQWITDRAPAPDAGPLAWFNVDDIDAALRVVAAHGGTVVEQPSPDGPTRMLATVLDPGGNRLGLVQHRAEA